jgi:phage terminase Nu1 subunit (DNA packaging protein)
MSTLVTRSQLAAHMDCAKSYVTKLGNQGRLVLAPDGRIELEPTLALIKSTTGAPERALDAVMAAGEGAAQSKAEQGRQAAPATPEPTYIDWKERKEKAQAEMAEMEVAKMRGQLLEYDAVRLLASSAATTLRTRLEMLPDQLAPVLAATSDEQQVRARLAVEIEGALADLAHELGKAVTV